MPDDADGRTTTRSQSTMSPCHSRTLAWRAPGNGRRRGFHGGAAVVGGRARHAGGRPDDLAVEGADADDPVLAPARPQAHGHDPVDVAVGVVEAGHRGHRPVGEAVRRTSSCGPEAGVLLEQVDRPPELVVGGRPLPRRVVQGRVLELVEAAVGQEHPPGVHVLDGGGEALTGLVALVDHVVGHQPQVPPGEVDLDDVVGQQRRGGPGDVLPRAAPRARLRFAGVPAPPKR